MRIIISAIAVLLLSGCGSSPNSKTTGTEVSTAESTKVTTAPVEAHGIGQGVQAAGVEFTLKSIEERAKPGDSPYAQPAGEGQVFVVAKYTTKNLGTKPVDPSGLPKVELVDASGTIYSDDLVASAFVSDESGIDNLNPGVILKSGKAWKVGKGAFDPGTWKIVVRTDPALEFKLK